MSPTSDPLSAARRASQVYHQQITEQITLSCGVAFVCARYPRLPEANHVREVVLPAGASMSSCIEQVNALYQQRRLTCYRWVPAAIQPIEPLEAPLIEQRYRPCRNVVMVWNPQREPSRDPQVRILPARAMRQALCDLRRHDDRYDEATQDMRAKADLDRLDDPQYDHFVAMIQGKPAGRGALLQAGPIGSIQDFWVAPAFRGRQVGNSLVAHLVALARRLALEVTVLEVPEDDTASRELFESCGFESAGAYIEFVRAS